MFAPERGASTESVSAPFPSVERSMVESRWVLVTPPRESSRCINFALAIFHIISHCYYGKLLRVTRITLMKS